MGVEFAVELQQTAHRTEVALVLEEQRLQRALGPVVHCVREQLHRDGVHAQEISHKDHLRVWKEKTDFMSYCSTPFHGSVAWEARRRV